MTTTGQSRIYILVRTDLGEVPLGKMVVQGAHAVSFLTAKYMALADSGIDLYQRILDYLDGETQAKIVLAVPDEITLQEMAKLCDEKGIVHALITDFGYTVFDGPTTTCLALGPITRQDADKLLNLSRFAFL